MRVSTGHNFMSIEVRRDINSSLTHLKDCNIFILGLFQVDSQVDQFVVCVDSCAGHLLNSGA